MMRLPALWRSGLRWSGLRWSGLRWSGLPVVCALLSACAGSAGSGASFGTIEVAASSVEIASAGAEDPGAPVAGLIPAGVVGTGGVAAAGFGHPVYTQAEIDAWSAGSPEYTRLAGSWAGNVNRAYATYGSEISSVERDVFRDESVYLKVQAVLWAADGNAARRDKVVALLNDLRAVTSFQTDSVEQYRLVAGWAGTNLAQAAAIIGYSDPEFRRFLARVCYPLLDWSNGGNWHASFADSRLAIAAYLGDPALWADAKAYFYRRIAQSIYHATYDGGKIRPLLNTNGAPVVGLTQSHWGGTWGGAQINGDFTPMQPAQFPNGTNAERTRDLAHVSMGLGAWMHGARTIRAQGENLEAQAFDRLRAAYAHHALRVLAYINTGVVPAPATVRGDGGDAYLMAWFGACTLFGGGTPADVVTLCRHSRVTGRPAAGANHLSAEAFADRT